MEVRASSVVVLPYAPASVAVARQRLCATLVAEGVLEPCVNDAAVVLSELISNALRHARPLPCGQVEAAWTWRNDIVQIAVSDGGAVTEPRRARPALSSLGGRGLGIVEALTIRWGVHRAAGTTTVWATLPAPRLTAADTCSAAPAYERHRRTTQGSHTAAPPAAMPGTLEAELPGSPRTLPGTMRTPVDCDHEMVRGGHRAAVGTAAPRFSEQPVAQCRELR
jgi:anti-sigma regulatory factor (Ser/Thr protein kinase)